MPLCELAQPLIGYSSGYAPPFTSVTWSTKPEIECSEKLSSKTPQVIPSLSSPTCVCASPAVINSFQACSPHDPKLESRLNHSCPSCTPLWGPSPRSTSTPHSSQFKSDPAGDEPVDTFIDRLIKIQFLIVQFLAINVIFREE